MFAVRERVQWPHPARQQEARAEEVGCEEGREGGGGRGPPVAVALHGSGGGAAAAALHDRRLAGQRLLAVLLRLLPRREAARSAPTTERAQVLVLDPCMSRAECAFRFNICSLKAAQLQVRALIVSMSAELSKPR